MATIKTETIGFDGGSYIRKISCSSNGKFSITLPSVVSEMLGIDQKISGSSLKEVEDEWSDVIAQFNAKKTTKDKMIVFQLALAGFNGHNDISFSSTPTVQFCAGVFIVTRVHLARRVNEVFEPVECGIPEDFIVRHIPPYSGDEYSRIPWTKEREEQIALFCRNFMTMLERLEKLFANPKTLQDAIDRNVKLLGSGE